MVHTDDRLALLEVARQLDVEAELGDISVSMLNYLPLLLAMDCSYLLIILLIFSHYLLAFICISTELLVGGTAKWYV